MLQERHLWPVSFLRVGAGLRSVATTTAIKSARVGPVNAIGVCVVGTRLAAACLVALNKSAKDVVVGGGLQIGLIDAVRA